MTNKEMAELFSVMLLAWPNAEIFKGGIQKLGPTIKLWTSCTADVDFWTGQQAVYQLCKTNRFPPTIAEFREQAKKVNDEIRALSEQTASEIRGAEMLGNSLTAFYEELPQGCFTKMVIDALGGTDALVIPLEQNGQKASIWNLRGIDAACRSIIQHSAAPIDGKLSVFTAAADRRVTQSRENNW